MRTTFKQPRMESSGALRPLYLKSSPHRSLRSRCPQWFGLHNLGQSQKMS